MASSENTVEIHNTALLVTAHEMAKRSGIGKNTLRSLMDCRKIDYLQLGSHRLLCDQAIWDYYERNKTAATT